MLLGSAGPPLRGFPRPGAARRAFARPRGNAAQAARAHPCLTSRRRPSMACFLHTPAGPPRRRFVVDVSTNNQRSRADRKIVVQGTSVSVSVVLVVRWIIKKKKKS